VASDVAGQAKPLKLDGRALEWDMYEFAVTVSKAYLDSLPEAKRVGLVKRIRCEMRHSLIPRARLPRVQPRTRGRAVRRRRGARHANAPPRPGDDPPPSRSDVAAVGGGR
jgi:hypothetical protein